MQLSSNQTTNKKIKIVFGIPSLSVGGIERQLLKQLALLNRERFDISLVTLFSYEHIPELYDSVPGDVTVYPVRWKGKLDFKALVRLIRFLSKTKPDIVVTSMFSANTIFRCIQPFLGYKSIAREHNLYYEKRWWHKVADHLLAYRSASLVAVSRSVALFASAQARIPIKKFTVIHNGVECDEIEAFKEVNDRALLRKQLSVRDDTKVFLNVGRLKLQKQQKLLIHSFALLPESCDVHLWIVGRGPEHEALQKEIDTLGLEHRVTLIGYTSKVFQYYLSADAFILTSKFEGFPNVAVEAMAFGLPLLSTDVPGVDEFLIDGENGLSLTADERSIADVLTKFVAMSSDVRHTMSVKALATAQQFDLTHTVAIYEKLYETVYANK